MSELIQVKNLTKEFNGFLAVDHVNFSAKAGEIFGLLGPNGAGKTTTLRTIATVLAPTSGTAVVAGYDIVSQPEDVRRHIGMLTTDIGVYERFSGRENLYYFGQLYGLSGEKLEQAVAELVQLLDMADFIDKRTGKYSTGMKQKLAIARSVIHNPDVMIFDEPTAGLDVLASQTVIRFMKKVSERGKLVILSTHEMTDAEKLCDRVAIMHQGRIVTVDTVENLKAKTGTQDLEETFVKLVHGDNHRRPDVTILQKSRAPKVKMSPLMMAILLEVVSILLIGIGILGNMQKWFSVGVGYIFIMAGLIPSFIARRQLKKPRPGPRV